MEAGHHGQELPNGSSLEEFVIELPLGSGGFGITYLAHDKSLGRKVVIKEHLPDSLSFRDISSMTVRPRHTNGQALDDYDWSLRSFLKEAEILASIEHPNIVRILRRFEANGTAYFVMPYVEGRSFDQIIMERTKQGSAFSEEELLSTLVPLLGAFEYLHSRHLYHRDVKPGNILLTSSGVPILIDFGAAREKVSDRSMTVIESAGYTPFEQTESRGNVGPWSDLYALGGVMRKAITFETPARSADRIRNDPMMDLASDPRWNGRYSAPFLESVDRALRVDEGARWQTAEEWLHALDPRGATSLPSNSPERTSIARVNMEQENLGKDQQCALPPVPGSKRSGPTVARNAASQSGSSSEQTALQSAGLPPKRKGRKASKVLAYVAIVLVLLAAGGSLVWKRWQAQHERSREPAGRESSEARRDSEREERPDSNVEVRLPDPPEWKRLATAGDAAAQCLLGNALLTGGSGFPIDPVEGGGWLAKAADQEHPLAIFLLAEQELTKAGDGETSWSRHPATADQQARFRKAFQLGLEGDVDQVGPVWNAALGRAYLHGLGTAKDSSKAAERLVSASGSGDSGAQFVLGEMHESGIGVARNLKRSLTWYEKAAINHHPPSCSALARLYGRGPVGIRSESKAFHWASEAASAGDSEGMRLLAEFYENGVGTAIDSAKVLQWYQAAATAGDAIAKGRLGIIYWEGEIVLRDDPRAYLLLKEAADAGYHGAYYPLGLMLDAGRGIEKNPARANRYYELAAAEGNVDAKYALASNLEKGIGTSADIAASIPLFREAAESGHTEAQYRYGLMILRGEGVRKDIERGAEMLKNAAENGLPLACFEWGRCLESGLGTKRDLPSAYRMYQSAESGGIAEAGFRVGLMLEEGKGIPKNESSARIRYLGSAKQGFVNSQVNLGIMLAQGRGGKRDEKEAVEWYRRAADQGDVDALVLLGMMCELGCGTSRNTEKAAEYYQQAAKQGDAEAAELLKALKP